MARIPIVERQLETRALPAGNTGSTLPTPQLRLPSGGDMGIGAVARAQQNFGQSIGNVAEAATDVYADIKKRGDQMRLIEAEGMIDDWEQQNIYDPDNGALNKKGKDAFSAPEIYRGKYDEDMTKIRNSLGNDDQRMAFDKMVTSRRNTVMHTLQNHTRQQMDAYGKSLVDSTIESKQTRALQYYNNIGVVNSSIQSAQEIVEWNGKQYGLPAETIAVQKQQIASKTYLGVLAKMADTDPKGAIDLYTAKVSAFTGEDLLSAQKMMQPVERKYKATQVAKQVLSSTSPIASNDSMIDFVMNDLEGGDKVVSDGGGIAKYGINSKANPDLDVATLTAEQARARYKEKYWNAIDADKLPADVRLVAFDAAVNHGVEKAKELLKESGGDARKLIELRAAEYDRLAKSDPEKYGQYLDGWKNRLATLGAQLDVMRGQIPSEVELNAKIDASTSDIEVAEDAKRLVKAQRDAIENARKQQEQEASREAWRYVNSGQQVPPTIESRMNPEDVAKMRKSAPPDMATYERVRADLLAGRDVNLEEHRWQLGSKYDDLVAIQQDPAKQVNARKVDDVIKSATGILLGSSTAKSTEDFQKVEDFRRAVDVQINNLQKTTGKPATSDDVQKITDKLLLNVTATEGWNTDKRAFELKAGEEYEVDGVPNDLVYVVKGKPVTYDVLVSSLQAEILKEGGTVNPESIKDMYERKLKGGQLAWKKK